MKTVKFGVFGISARGRSICSDILLNNGEIVAVCDVSTSRLKEAKEQLGDIATYTDFDEFIAHKGMDAVFLCNYFHEHAEYAIKALKKNIHVLSECLSNVTMAEGVALVRAAEQSSAIYMLAENYPFMTFNREIKRVCDEGSLGRILMAEGEYNHPFSPYENWYYKPYAKHWRNLLPATYYVTHSLAPLMFFTGAFPKRVTAMPVFAEYSAEDHLDGMYKHDRAAMLTTLNDDDSVFRFSAWSHFGAVGNHYRVCGTHGQIENITGMGSKILLRYNKWQKPEGMEEVNYYDPVFNDKDEELIRQADHDGGDFICAREFIRCITENRRPVFDEYFATFCSSVAILGHRSQMENGVPYDIPDFRREEDRRKYENDVQSPFYYTDGRIPTIRSSSRPITVDQVKIDNYENAWHVNSILYDTP